MVMQRTAAAVVACMGLATAAFAQPNVNGAKLNTRIFNDFPNSNLTTINNYPAQVQISDANLVNSPPSGFANRHNFRLSSDGGATNAQFMNADRFSLFSDVTLSGSGNGEIGLQISPWWSQNVDGVLFMNGATGEIAAFGGRLPFYSFTASQGATYTFGSTVRLGFEYEPHSNTAADPAQIRYWCGALNSGWINFDEGNPAEPYGTWGILNSATVGGYVQAVGPQTGAGNVVATFGNISYVPAPGAAGVLALAGLFASRRRRGA